MAVATEVCLSVSSDEMSMTVKRHTAGSHFSTISRVSGCLNANVAFVGGAFAPMPKASSSETAFCIMMRVMVAGKALAARVFSMFLRRRKRASR